MDFRHLPEALKQGAILKVFPWGLGLRVARLEKGKEILAYAESDKNLEEVLWRTDEDLRLGGQAFDEVYGKKYKREYAGHTPKSDDPLDAFIYNGARVEIVFAEKEFLLKEQGENKILARGERIPILLGEAKKAFSQQA